MNSQFPRPILKNPKKSKKKPHSRKSTFKSGKKSAFTYTNVERFMRQQIYVWRDLMEGNLWGNIYPFWKDLGTFLYVIFKNQMLKNGSKKVPQEFRCEKCNYSGVRESQWKRHLETKKHNATKCYKNATKSVPHYECDCGKIYKHHSSFSRHKKVCKFEKSNDKVKWIYKNGVDEKARKLDTLDILKTLMYDNKLLHGEVSSMLIPSIAKTPMTNNTINSNNNNKIINVQMFLSEKCADAISIQHFAKQLGVTLDDVLEQEGLHYKRGLEEPSTAFANTKTLSLYQLKEQGVVYQG